MFSLSFFAVFCVLIGIFCFVKILCNFRFFSLLALMIGEREPGWKVNEALGLLHNCTGNQINNCHLPFVDVHTITNAVRWQNMEKSYSNCISQEQLDWQGKLNFLDAFSFAIYAFSLCSWHGWQVMTCIEGKKKYDFFRREKLKI